LLTFERPPQKKQSLQKKLRSFRNINKYTSKLKAKETGKILATNIRIRWLFLITISPQIFKKKLSDANR
jgi:hypothetical protein